jgi:hypothetical protein
MFVLIAMLAAFPLAAGATHSWGGYHWARTSNPFTLKVGDNVSTGWDSYLNTTVSDWSQSNVLDLTKVTGSTTGRKCRPTAGRIEVCNAAYGNNGWLGLAQIWLSNGHISQGTAKMNDSYFNLAQYNNADEKNHVMCQEVGHTFGLGHTSEDGSTQNTCMDYSQSPTSTAPNQHDYDMLASIYSHLDSTTTIGSAPAGFANADVHAQENWGQKVSESADGRSAIFVRDFGNNYVIVTHVTWAK